ncbi:MULTISPECIES: ABC transporter ATP-binding protein [unclassified Acidisoma]|jgi:multiple sugar transport system ATP-binding protein|uniref:ABC transporter ATP-binding protein n=1 Tax=unclassified Acidisoma TaxID=2634065 RepID=UPI00131C5413|nr:MULTISPECIES: ABC transporter ATP-binding protein [unclassified Acidisoma]
MSFLTVQRLSKAYKKQEVIQDLSFTVDRLETLVVFGPSGAGKTVLLRLIAGMIRPDRGNIIVDGRDITDLNPEHRHLGMAFQNFALYPHMTAYENIASPLRSRRIAQSEVDQRVHEVAKLLRIDHVVSHLPKALSNGQKQRTALARSLIAKPNLILLDDPLRNVDAKVRYEMRLELPQLLRARETTVVYVTQDYKEAMALGDRIAVLVDGRIEQIATPREIYERPANSRIARLFGDPPINLLPVSTVPGSQGAQIRVASTDVALPGGAGARDGCVLGLRPEDVAVGFEAQPGAMPVEIDAVTPLNDREVMLLRARDGTEIFASAPQGHMAGSGQRGRREAWATLDLSHSHFFDTAGGARL